MFRSVVFVAAVIWLTGTEVVATEPDPLVIVAVDREVASAIPPLPEHARLVVLVEDVEQTYEGINMRALQLCGASHFVHAGNGDHGVTAIFRERFRNHGTRIVDLRTYAKPARPDVYFFAGPTPSRLFADLLERR